MTHPFLRPALETLDGGSKLLGEGFKRTRGGRNRIPSNLHCRNKIRQFCPMRFKMESAAARHQNLEPKKHRTMIRARPLGWRGRELGSCAEGEFFFLSYFISYLKFDSNSSVCFDLSTKNASYKHQHRCINLYPFIYLSPYLSKCF
jgi:hypothetical protein